MPRKKAIKPNPRWHKFHVRRKNGAWVAVYSDPEKPARIRTKNGKTYTEENESLRVLRYENGTVPTTEEAAHELADVLYNEVEIKRIRFREKRPFDQSTLDGDVTHWPIAASIDDWMASYASARTRKTNESMIRHFRNWLQTQPLEFLHDLTYQHGVEFRDYLDRLDVPGVTGKRYALRLAKTFLSWCWNAGRLTKPNPFTERKIPAFHDDEDEGLDDIAVVFKRERDKLFQACRDDQERLMFLLATLVGLRNAEVVHLRWKDYRRHQGISQLHITAHSGWRPKNGKARLAVILYPEVVAALDHWKAITPYGNEPDQRIIINGETGEPYVEIPQKWHSWLRDETKIEWTPRIGRHTACSLFPLYSERVSGRAWTAIEHSQQFGHSITVSEKHYIHRSIADLAENEGLNGNGGAGDVDAEMNDGVGMDDLPSTSFSIPLAKKVLTRWLETAGIPREWVAEKIGISEAAIRKWLNQGKSLPRWYWPAIEALVDGQTQR